MQAGRELGHAHDGPAPRRTSSTPARSPTPGGAREGARPRRRSSGSSSDASRRHRRRRARHAAVARWRTRDGDSDHARSTTTGGTSTGKIVKGRLEAPSEGAVAARLRTMGVSPDRRSPRRPPAPACNRRSILGLRQGRRAQGPRDHEPADGDDDRRPASRSCGRSTILAEQTENKKLATILSRGARRRRDRVRRSPTAMAKHPRRSSRRS